MKGWRWWWIFEDKLWFARNGLRLERMERWFSEEKKMMNLGFVLEQKVNGYGIFMEKWWRSLWIFDKVFGKMQALMKILARMKELLKNCGWVQESVGSDRERMESVERDNI